MNTKSAIIRCPVHGSVTLSNDEIRLIDSQFLQRLRNISQLGFASYVFPGAVHTRFSHSLGAIHLAGRVFDQLLKNPIHPLSDFYSQEQLRYYRQILRYAALLHDAGHPPFSHAAESLLPPLKNLETDLFRTIKEDRKATHEEFSQMIIHHLADQERLLSDEEAEDVISLLSKVRTPSSRMLASNGQPMIYPLLCQLINGEVDVDRMDYLLRDAYFAGVPYGKYDLDRLINSFTCCREEKTNSFLLALDGEGVPSYEIFLLARVHMFYQIYFHKSLGAYRYYLRKAFAEGEVDYTIDGTIQNFLNLTETKLQEEFSRHRDKKWSGKIFYRTPAKNLIRVLDGETHRLKKLNTVKEILKENGIETIYSHSSNQYSSQIKNKGIDHNTLLVIDKEFGKTTIGPLAEKSSLLGEEETLIEISQLYVHREDYQTALDLINQKLKD